MHIKLKITYRNLNYLVGYGHPKCGAYHSSNGVPSSMLQVYQVKILWKVIGTLIVHIAMWARWTK